MPSSILSNLKAVRNGVALLGVVTMLSLSACTPAPAPAPETSASETSKPEVSSTPAPTEVVESDDSMSYPAPAVGAKTSVGEPIKEAEARFVAGAKKRVTGIESDSKILNMGYETCKYYAESANNSEFFQKLEDASNGDHDTEVNYVYISGASANTLCPEFTNFK